MHLSKLSARLLTIVCMCCMRLAERSRRLWPHYSLVSFLWAIFISLCHWRNRLRFSNENLELPQEKTKQRILRLQFIINWLWSLHMHTHYSTWRKWGVKSAQNTQCTLCSKTLILYFYTIIMLSNVYILNRIKLLPYQNNTIQCWHHLKNAA